MTEINVTHSIAKTAGDISVGQFGGVMMMSPDQIQKFSGIRDGIAALYADGKLADSEVSKLADLKKQLDTLAGGMQSWAGIFPNFTKTEIENVATAIEKDLKAFAGALQAEANAVKTELQKSDKAEAADFLASLDIATALMFVQSERVARLEEQIKDQLATVSKRNEQIGKLNGVLTELNGLVGKIGGTDATSKLPATQAEIDKATAAATAAGFKIDPAITSNTTRGDLEKLVSKVKNEIDGLSNTQQMDMLRLQSLNNKRNEAFEIMTNVMKKVSDLLSNIASKLG